MEKYYTFGFYPVVSKILRAILGWIPFSFGDLLYLAAFILFVLKAWKFIRLLAKRQVKEYLSWILFRKYLKLVLWIYIVFNLFWGLNYDRQGIAKQFGLNVQHYTPGDLYELTSALQQRLNFYATKVDSLKRLSLSKNQILFKEGIAAYENASKQYSFLTYDHPSIKPSMLTYLGRYFGFTGYYNPFTGEAQLKTDVPVFTKPFIVCHEIGHQLGYAKENEANFSSYLAGRVSDNIEFRYSVYYDMYGYAMNDLFVYNPSCFVELKESEHPQVKKDNRAYRDYILRSRNAVEPVMSLAYDRYLKMNNQPRGKEAYNEVVGWLMAYMKKYGEKAL
ncbi:MAG TPA: DUF3810 domain-containing protein [Flavisolibacter sp.]|nr:DUF3810 domain-containing protein [Flavisolibacter sp.]